MKKLQSRNEHYAEKLYGRGATTPAVPTAHKKITPQPSAKRAPAPRGTQAK